MQNFPLWVLVGAIGAAVVILPDIMKARNVSKVVKAEHSRLEPLIRSYDTHGAISTVSKIKSIEDKQEENESVSTYHGHDVEIEKP